MLRKTLISPASSHTRWTGHVTYSQLRRLSARSISSEASVALKQPTSGFFDTNQHTQNSYPTFLSPHAGHFAEHQPTPQALARQAAHAIRTAVLKNNDQRGAYAILNSLHRLSSQNNRIPTRLATSALVHSLVRVGSPFRAAQIAEIAWIGTSDAPKDFALSMKLHWKTSDSVMKALTAHHTLSSQHSPPEPPTSPQDLEHTQYLEERAGVGEGTQNLSTTKLDHASQRALLFLRVARNARQKRQQAMYSRLIEACLFQGEIIVATLLFVLLVRDYQVRKLVKAAKDELKEKRFTAEASVEETPSITHANVLQQPLFERRTIGWLSTVSPDILAKLDNLKNVDVEKAAQLGLDQVDEAGEICLRDAPVPSGEYLKRICSTLDIKRCARAVRYDQSSVAVGGEGLSIPVEIHPPAILAFAELARLAKEQALDEYGNLPEQLAHYAASGTPMQLQPRVASRSALLDSYALKAVSTPARPAEETEDLLLGTLSHHALLTISRGFVSPSPISLTRSSQNALVQYAYFCNLPRLAAKLVKTIQDREGRISTNTYSAIITGLVKSRKLEAARHVIDMVNGSASVEATPMAKVLMRAIVGEAVEPEPQPQEQPKTTGKVKKLKEKTLVQPTTPLPEDLNELLTCGPVVNKQDNLSIALMYYASATSQSSTIASTLHIILPHAFDDSLLFPATCNHDDVASLNLVTSYGPRFYIELMNALRKGGHTGLVERVWKVAIQASKHSWRVYIKRKMREVFKPHGAIKKPIRVSLNYAASSRALPGLDASAGQPTELKATPNGAKVSEARVWDDMPWVLDIGAWTMLMKIYGVERKKSLTLAHESQASQYTSHHSASRNPNNTARGWGGVPSKCRDVAPQRCDLALECANALHNSLAYLHKDMAQFVGSVWTERLEQHGRYDPRKSTRRGIPSNGELETQRRDLELLKTRVFHKLERAIPVPDERYFNATLQVFGRDHQLKRRSKHARGRNAPLQDRFVQVPSLPPSNPDSPSASLYRLCEDMEDFGYDLPEAYRLSELAKPDQDKATHIIPVVSKRTRCKRSIGARA